MTCSYIIELEFTVQFTKNGEIKFFSNDQI